MDKLFFGEHFSLLSKGISAGSLDRVKQIINSQKEPSNIVRTYKPRHICDFLQTAKETHGITELNFCQKALILGFIDKNFVELSPKKIGLEVKAYQYFLERMSVILLDNSYTFKSMDLFWKELAIARLQFFPIPSGVVDFYSGFGVRQGISINPIQTLRFFKLLLSVGQQPYYRTHLHTPLLDFFTEDDWVKSYLQIAEMLKRDESIKGLVRTSWYFDPHIKIISPHLGYLQDLPMKNGAKLFRVGKDESGNALSTSKSRRELYDKGDYIPMDYLLVWPRNEMIKWFDAQR